MLVFINEQGQVHYVEVLKAARANKVAESTSQINAVLKTLQKYGLVDQKVIAEKRPIRTLYSLSKRGKRVLELLKQIEDEIE